MNKKTILKVCIALVIGSGLFFIVNHLTQPPTTEGQKEITILISAPDYFNEITVTTDTLTLGGLLAELSEQGILSITLDGSSGDVFGRTLVEISGHQTVDWTSGPWWVFNSPNNQSCLEAGFCAGIDQTPITDGDIFEFEFISSFD